MANHQQDFQKDLLHHLQPIAQQEDNLQTQNNHLPNSITQLENSFIHAHNSFQTENQNINFSDHTHFFKEKQSHLNHPQTLTGNNRLSNYSQHDTGLYMPQRIEAQEFTKTQKLQEQKSQNKSFYPGEQNLSMTEQFSESFNDNNFESIGRRGNKKKILPQNINLSHKEHMLLGGKVISGLEKNIVSLPFREPVDIERYNIPDYLEIVKQPMDLKTIKRKIFNEDYDTVDQIYTDIELIVANSMKYNEFNPDFMKLTRNFQKSYHKIRRDCERNMRKLKNEEEKKVESFPIIQKSTRKITKPIQNNFPSNDVNIMSSFEFKQLTRLAKKIRKLQVQEQIQLFKKIGILNTMVIDIKTLTTKQVKLLMKEVDRVEKSTEEFIRNEQKKENSHLTTCDNEYRNAA